MTRPRGSFIGLTLAMLGILALASCASDDGDNVQSQATPTAAATPSGTPQPTATAEPTATVEPTVTGAPEEVVVNVYWLHDTQIAVGGRVVETPAVGRAALEELIAGPNQLETELGMVSAVPGGTEVLGLAIEDGLATVDLSSDFEKSGLGTSGELGLVSQIVFTLTQFPTVDAVTITIAGEDRDAILSHGLEARNLTRESLFDAVMPAILVESPYPGELVTSPMRVEGLSRTFEATVVYVTTIPPSDEIVDEGFTTAAQPDIDQFGPFEFTTDFGAPAVAGFGALIVFEESAADGSQINVYEVPVRMEP
jgi:germination protein M